MVTIVDGFISTFDLTLFLKPCTHRRMKRTCTLRLARQSRWFGSRSTQWVIPTSRWWPPASRRGISLSSASSSTWVSDRWDTATHPDTQPCTQALFSVRMSLGYWLGEACLCISLTCKHLGKLCVSIFHMDKMFFSILQNSSGSEHLVGIRSEDPGLNPHLTNQVFVS